MIGKGSCSMPNLKKEKIESLIKETMLNTIFSEESILKKYDDIRKIAISSNTHELTILKKWKES